MPKRKKIQRYVVIAASALIVSSCALPLVSLFLSPNPLTGLVTKVFLEPAMAAVKVVVMGQAKKLYAELPESIRSKTDVILEYKEKYDRFTESLTKLEESADLKDAEELIGDLSGKAEKSVEEQAELQKMMEVRKKYHDEIAALELERAKLTEQIEEQRQAINETLKDPAAHSEVTKANNQLIESLNKAKDVHESPYRFIPPETLEYNDDFIQGAPVIEEEKINKVEWQNLLQASFKGSSAIRKEWKPENAFVDVPLSPRLLIEGGVINKHPAKFDDFSDEFQTKTSGELDKYQINFKKRDEPGAAAPQTEN